ncbi:MAG TPA: HIT domain-containing protein [Actinomycetales bacterium]|nr:HIT domain-containing protein [Actinomycetales bacterium]
MEDDCIFCQIAAGNAPATVVSETDRVLAIRDIDPQAPVHVLVLPKEHHNNVGSLSAVDPSLLAEMIATGTEIAENECDGEFRLVFNTGRNAGQTVFHVHGHILGGRSMTWPPG